MHRELRFAEQAKQVSLTKADGLRSSLSYSTWKICARIFMPDVARLVFDVSLVQFFRSIVSRKFERQPSLLFENFLPLPPKIRYIRAQARL